MSEIKFLDSLSSCFEKLPGVGNKTAKRFSYFVVEKMSKEEVERFSKELVNTKQKVKHCSVCGMLCLDDKCEICSDNERDQSKILVVKDSKDVISMEKTQSYNGLYHCLNGLISPLDGVGPDDININSLEKRITSSIKEIILATSFTPAGETTALYLENILAKPDLTISRLGYGIPAGGDIEYVDELTLKRAFENRTKK